MGNSLLELEHLGPCLHENDPVERVLFFHFHFQKATESNVNILKTIAVHTELQEMMKRT